MGTKYIILPCITDFEKYLPLAYSNKAVCVYENPLFKPIIDSPETVIITKTPQQTADAYILEDCYLNCKLEKNKATIKNVQIEPETINFNTESNESSFVLVRMSYFEPHWHTYIDGKETKIRKAWPDYMLIEVPAGKYYIEFKYESNIIHLIAKIITLLAVLYLIFIMLPENIIKKVFK
jgi:uncharacterized membrane protein YfhO